MRKTLVFAVAMALALPCRGGWIFDGRPSHWEGFPGELQPADESYPVLVLALGGQWTDFELKASTNNFTSLVYYYVSSAANVIADDDDPYIYFTDDYAADVRKWNKAAVHTSILSQLVSGESEIEYVYVFPSHTCDIPWEGWMSKDNPKLVWSYVRFDGVNFEMNVAGTKQHWNAIRPEHWERERTTP